MFSFGDRQLTGTCCRRSALARCCFSRIRGESLGQGWFGGRRPNILWWRAVRHLSSNPGCHITVFSTEPREIDVAPEMVLLDAVFQGRLPADAQDPVIPSWLRSEKVEATQVNNLRFGVLICFRETRINLGDIATGPVKHVLDCLYPVLGGSPGSPEDWRIELLQVEKNCDHLQDGTFRLQIWVVGREAKAGRGLRIRQKSVGDPNRFSGYP